MNSLVKLFGLILTALAIVGCGAHGYFALSSHTLRAGPETSADVVWIEDNEGAVFRCAVAQNGPRCHRVALQP